MRPGLAHGLVGVGGAEDPGERRDGVAGQAPRVARAVEALPVLHDDPGQRGQGLGLLQHPLGEVRVQAHPLPLAGAERAGLVPDRVRHAQPPELVHEPGSPERRTSSSPRSRWRPAAAASSATAVGVAEHVRRLQVDELGDRPQRAVDAGTGQHDRQRRLGVDHRLPGPDLGQPVEDLLGVVAEDPDEVRIELRPAAPLGDARAAVVPPVR